MTASQLFEFLKSSQHGTLSFRLVLAAWSQLPAFGYDKTRRPSSVVIEGKAQKSGSAKLLCRTKDHLGFGNFEIRVSRNGLLVTRWTDGNLSTMRQRVYAIAVRADGNGWTIQAYGKVIQSLRERTPGCQGELGPNQAELSFVEN